MDETNSIGRAYAFFNCRASKTEIELELPYIRKISQTPRELELSLTEDFSQLRLDLQLLRISIAAKEAGIKYAIEAKYPNSTNKIAADELSGILNQAYQSDLYNKGETFRGCIFFEENGRYIARE